MEPVVTSPLPLLSVVIDVLGAGHLRPPEALSAPFALDVEHPAPVELPTIRFYGPVVLTLLLQHLAVTLGTLSMARVRLQGCLGCRSWELGSSSRSSCCCSSSPHSAWGS